METVKGYFKSKRGVYWNYEVFSNGYVEMWHENVVRCTGGWKRGKDTIKSATPELIKYIKETHGIDAKNYDAYSETKAKRTNLTAVDSCYYHNGKLERGFGKRVVWESEDGTLMVKHNGWEGIGEIERTEGKAKVYPWGKVRIYGDENEYEIVQKGE